jgi:4-carboxymuconolactone decarboxylase
MTAEPTPAQKLIGDFAPKMVQLTDEVLFGDIWERPGPSPRDRSLITVTTLVALYRTEQLGRAGCRDQLRRHRRRLLARRV